MPRLMFTWAPLEASFALATFGALSGHALGTAAPAVKQCVAVCVLQDATSLQAHLYRSCC